MEEIIRLEGYTFTYAGAARPAISNIDLKIDAGEVAIIAGPSGCGKSTLLRSINGLIPHMYSGLYSGSVFVGGVNVAEVAVSELAKKVGFVFQNPENQIFMFSVERDIAFGLENLGLPRQEIRGRVDWAMNLLKITDLAHRAPHELSDGQKQRVAIAGVLAMKPRILVLDEPTSLLDPRSASDLIGTVKELREILGITVLIVEHRLDLLAGIADHVVVLENGKKVLDGDPRAVLADDRAMSVGIGVPAITRLHKLLKGADIPVGEVCLTPHELSDRVNAIID